MAIIYQEYSDAVASGDAVTGVLSGLGNVRITVVDVAAAANATIYSDQGVTPKSNPFTTTIGGKIDFFAAQGKQYRIDIHDLNGSPRISDQSRYWLPGVIDTDAATLGLTNLGLVRRGKSIIAATEARTNIAYGLMTTPDRVQNIVLPTDGLIAVAYQALWQESVNGAAKAAIFIGANQLKIPQATSVPIVSETSTGSPGAARDIVLTSSPDGVRGGDATGNFGAEVTTGQVIGGGDNKYGICYIFAAAGTYDISVQFKSSSGSVTVHNRKLWVWTTGF